MPEARETSAIVGRSDRAGAGFSQREHSLHPALARSRSGAVRGECCSAAPGKADPVYPDFKLDRQFRVMECLRDTAVPVPAVYWGEPDASLFELSLLPDEPDRRRAYRRSFLAIPLLRHLPRCHARETRARMWWRTLEATAAVHALDWESAGSRLPRRPAGRVSPRWIGELDYWEALSSTGQSDERPADSRIASLRWLRARAGTPRRANAHSAGVTPACPTRSSDPPARFARLLDWDMAILSDPVSDLSFFLIALDHLLSEGIGRTSSRRLPRRGSETTRGATRR